MTGRDPIDRLKRFQALNSFELPIEVSRIYLYESSPEPWGLKDLNSRYIYVNKAYHDLLNLPDNSDVTGKTFEDIMGRSEFSDHVRMNELLVIERREPIYSREVKRFGRDRELKPYIFKRMPCFSSSSDIIALEFNGTRAARPVGISATHCHYCGDPVPERRRDALPGVTTCVDCQHTEELLCPAKKAPNRL